MSSRKKKYLFIFLLIVLFTARDIFAFEFDLSYGSLVRGWRINTNQINIQIPGGECKKVRSLDGKARFVPTKNSVGWNAFSSNIGGRASINECINICEQAGGIQLSNNTCLFNKMGNYVYDLSQKTGAAKVTVIGGGGTGIVAWFPYGGGGGGGTIHNNFPINKPLKIRVGKGGYSWYVRNGETSSVNGALFATGGQGGYSSYGRSSIGGIGSGGNQNCRGGSGGFWVSNKQAFPLVGGCSGGGGAIDRPGGGGGATPYGGMGGTATCGAGGSPATPVLMANIAGFMSSGRYFIGGDGCVVVEFKSL